MEENNGLNLASRPATPHQFAKLAETLRSERDRGFLNLADLRPAQPLCLPACKNTTALPSSSPQPRDYKLSLTISCKFSTHAALKYQASRTQWVYLPHGVVVTDREFFLVNTPCHPSYIRAPPAPPLSKLTPTSLQQVDYVVHRNHGVGYPSAFESTINNETCEQVQYADGLLRVVSGRPTQVFGPGSRSSGAQALQNPNNMSGKAWEKTKSRVRKAIKKLAVDLLKLYAARSRQTGFAYQRIAMPWQEELEDSFPHQATTWRYRM